MIATLFSPTRALWIELGKAWKRLTCQHPGWDEDLCGNASCTECGVWR